jgi:hypothetical protein
MHAMVSELFDGCWPGSRAGTWVAWARWGAPTLCAVVPMHGPFDGRVHPRRVHSELTAGMQRRPLAEDYYRIEENSRYSRRRITVLEANRRTIDGILRAACCRRETQTRMCVDVCGWDVARAGS